MRIKSSIFILLIQVFALSSICAQGNDTIKYYIDNDTIRYFIDSDGIEHYIYSDGIEECVDIDGTLYLNCEDIIKDMNYIYVYAEQMPEFPEGNLALRRYIAKNLKYPTIHRECAIDGTVFIRFEVTKTGEIGKVELQKGVDPLIDKEAIRVIKSLPKFKPGKHQGKEVNVWYSIPISIHLN